MDAWFVITLLGSPEFWTGLSFFLIGLFFLMRGYGRKAPHFRNFLMLMLPTLFITLIAVQGLKVGLAVPRPCVPCDMESSALCNPYCPGDYSFPSGHAAIMFSVFTAAFLTANKKYKVQIVLGYIIALVVTLSRIMLGVHTFIDIVGGAALGIAIAVFVMFFAKKYGLIKSRKL